MIDESISLYTEDVCISCFDYCGGIENIVEIECCTTRVRIELKKVSLADLDKLKTLPLVQGVWARKTEVQLVIGFEAFRVAKLFQNILEK